MKTAIIVNMSWNAFFIFMAFSEMIGLSNIHESLPWYFKWWWIAALSGGNLIIHCVQLSMCDKKFR